MKSKIRKIVIFLALLSVCVFAFAGCRSTVIDRLKNRYGVDTRLLTDYEILCDISGETFTGYAPHYAVIRFKAEPTAFLQSFTTDKSDGFSFEKNEEIRNELDAHSCMEIPTEYYPNWNDDYIWRGSGGADGLYMVYFPHDFKLVVFETGH